METCAFSPFEPGLMVKMFPKVDMGGMFRKVNATD
jgi:hypothetical protein